MPRVYIGLGSNKGDKEKNIKKALGYLEKKIKVHKVSSLYLTEPVGVEGGWFVNCALEGETEKKPKDLLQELLQIEYRMGRRRTGTKGSRVIDLDLLLYGEMVSYEEDLILPHPRLHERKFVLIPLIEINPHLYHPAFRKPLKTILNTLEDPHQVKKIVH